MIEQDQLQRYLVSVCESSQNWWEPYAEFIEEINASTWFEFGLKAKKSESRRQKEEEKEENSPKAVLDVLRGAINEPILLVGGPGAGKSTLLAKVLVEKAQQALQVPEAPIPVLVELNLYGASGIWGLIQAALENHDLYLDFDDIQQLFADRRIVLLADGVNELGEDKFRTELKSFCRSRNKAIILTTRDLGGDLGIERKLEIQPLSSGEVETFLRDRLPLHDRKRVKELCDRVRDFGQTPLMVWMLYRVFSQNGEIPATRGEAYRAFTTLYVERAKEGIDLADCRSLLATLAFEMMQSKVPTELRLDLSEADAQKLLGGEKVLKPLLKYHLLQRFGRPENYRIRFCHQSLQEYYAAEALLEKLDDAISDDELKQDYLNYLKWTEAIAFMMSLLDETTALDSVKLSLEVDLQLGARLAGEAKKKFQKQTIESLNTYKFKNGQSIPSQIKIELLARSQSNEAVQYLLEIIQDEDADACCYEDAAAALGKIGGDIAISALKQAIRSTRWYIAYPAVEALKKIGTEKILPALSDALLHEEGNVRCIATDAVASINSESTIPILLKALGDDSGNVRKRAIAGLGKFDSKEVFSALIYSIWDEDEETQLTALYIIEKRKLKSAISHLQKLVDDPWLCWYCDPRDSLFTLPDPNSPTDLISNPSDMIDGSWVYSSAQKEAARVLQQLNGLSFTSLNKQFSLPPIQERFQTDYLLSKLDFIELQESFESADLKTCHQVKAFVEELGESAAYKLLRTSYENLDISGRISQIIEANILGNVIPDLLEILDNGNLEDKKSASLVLTKIGLEAAIPNLIKALKDWFHATRRESAILLGKLRVTDAVSALVEVLLSDKKDDVLQYTAEALGEIGSEAAVPALIETLRCDDNDFYQAIRWCAAKALADIGSEEAILALVEAWRTELIPGFDLVQAIEKIEKNTVACALPHFSEMISTETDASILRAIAAIQSRCGFYNYEIAQAAVEKGKRLKGKEEREEGRIINNFFGPVGNLNTGTVNIQGDQVGEKHQLLIQNTSDADTKVTKTILILASSPGDKGRLRLDQEVREIEEALRRSQKRDQFKLEQRWAVRTEDLRRALLDIQPQIVHFCGHGTGTAGLLFEDEQGLAKPVSAEALANLFELFADQIECIVLNACHSDVQANAIGQHIPYVIGMQDAVKDLTAIQFATGFYDGLGGRGADSKGYEMAYKLGCTAIALENLPGHLTPKLLKKADLSKSNEP